MSGALFGWGWEAFDGCVKEVHGVVCLGAFGFVFGCWGGDMVW